MKELLRSMIELQKKLNLKIESYKEAKGEKRGEEGFFIQLIGKFLHISFLISLLSIYLFLVSEENFLMIIKNFFFYV